MNPLLFCKMDNISNDLSGAHSKLTSQKSHSVLESKDPSQLSLLQKIKIFEDNFKDREVPNRKFLSSLNIFPKFKDASSNSDNLATTPSPQQGNLSSSNGYLLKQSTSTTDNNRVSSAAVSSSSNEYSKHVTTPSSTNSSGNGIRNLEPSQHSTAKKTSKVRFEKAQNKQEEQMKIPDILEVFTDLDLFIEKELNEISYRKRLGEKLAEYEKSEQVFTKLKHEYLEDKQQHQKEFERQINQGDDQKLSMIHEEECEIGEKAEISLDVIISSKMIRLKQRKIKRLRLEAKKQEYLLTKINRVLEMAIIEDRNISDVINIERHYLVASMRLQAALSEHKRLTSSEEPLHPRPFHHKGTCTVSEVMLEVKQRYFDRINSAPNEFFLVLLKNDEEIYASRPIQIIDDIRTVKFPETFKIQEAFADFLMRLEVYGTTMWRKKNMVRPTMLKKHGFVNFTLSDTGEKRKRIDVVEVIKNDHNPLRKKILLKIHQTITPDVHFKAFLFVKLGDSWYKALAKLHGHLLEINLIPEVRGSDEHDVMLLDLHNFDSNFVIPVVSHVSKKPFTFLLKFNHYVDKNDFYLLVAAESEDDFTGWVNSINKALVLMK